MSLVVCSNLQGEFEVPNGRAGDNANLFNSAPGLSRPYAFQNHINPPMNIPKNSEVALQSIKINRSGNYELVEPKTFALYIGEEIQNNFNTSVAGKPVNATDGSVYANRSLSGTAGEVKYTGTTSMPFNCTLRAGTYTPQQMASEISRAFTTAIGHPDNFLTTNVCEQDDANEKGTGFLFGWTHQQDQEATNRVVGRKMLDGEILGRIASISVSSAVGGGAGTNVQFDTDKAELKRIDDGGGFKLGSCALTTFPISLYNGHLTADVSSCLGGFKLGLVRPFQVDGRESPSYYDGTPINFYDYVVEWSQEGAETEKTLKLKHAVWDGVGGESMVMKTINYWESGLTAVAPAIAPGNVQITETYLSTAGAPAGTPPVATAVTIKKIDFHMKGECITLTMTDSADTEYLLQDTSGAFGNGGIYPADLSGTQEILKTKCWKPVGQTCWTMYPAFSIAVKDETMVIDKYGGLKNGVYPPTTTGDFSPVVLPNFESPLRAKDIIKYPYPEIAKADGTDATPGQSYYMRGFIEPDAIKGCRNIDSRSCYISDDGIKQKDYVSIKGTDETDSGIAMSWGIIAKPSNKGYNTRVPGSYTAPNIDDCGGILGLQGAEAFTSTWCGEMFDLDDGTTGRNWLESGGLFTWWCLPSFDRPTITTGSLFVRCPTLTHQSYNMGKGIPSKIIYQIPRFSIADNNGGRVGAGELYFEPAQMTYLDLNNPTDLTFNDIKLEIVDKNEQYAKDLTGASTLVLHFRQKR